MINTLFFQDTLNTPQAFALSLLIGILFGFILERAGFGSSRKLAGVFYLKDIPVCIVTVYDYQSMITDLKKKGKIELLNKIESHIKKPLTKNDLQNTAEKIFTTYN